MFNEKLLRDQLNLIPSLFDFEFNLENNIVTINTPYEYPDGDEIDLFLITNNKLILSDMGESIRHLTSYNINIKESKRRTYIIEDIIRNSDVKYFKDEFYIELKDIKELSSASIELAQTIIRISDLLFTIKGRTIATFEEEVKDFLDYSKYDYEEGYLITGKSSIEYEMDFGIKIKNNIKLVKLVNCSNVNNIQAHIDKLIRTWFDISYGEYSKKDLKISLFDDTSYAIKPEIIKLVSEISIPTYWSNKEDLKKILDAA